MIKGCQDLAKTEALLNSLPKGWALTDKIPLKKRRNINFFILSSLLGEWNSYEFSFHSLTAYVQQSITSILLKIVSN